MAQHGSVQGVLQASVLGQFRAGLLDQVLRRLAQHAEHQYAFVMEEDVFSRGIHEPGIALRDEDVIRVRHTKLDQEEEWAITTHSRPLPVRENHDVLLRGISTVPVLEGDARSLAVALGYSERRFANTRKGWLFNLHGSLTTVQIFQTYSPPDASEPLDSHFFVAEIVSITAHRPTTTHSQTAPMQVLREHSISRTLEVKRLLKGLVDLTRVD